MRTRTKERERLVTSETGGADRLKLLRHSKSTEKENRERRPRAKRDRKRDTPRGNYSEKEIETEILPRANYSDTHILPRVNYSEAASQEGKRPLNENLLPPNKKQKNADNPGHGSESTDDT